VTIDLYPSHVLYPEVFGSRGDPRLVPEQKYLGIQGLGFRV
jgi:hypothetical protein